MKRPWWMLGPVRQEPTAPASAYEIVASLLPMWFLHRRSPTHGWRFDVVGVDRRVTTWFVPDELARTLDQQLRAHRQIVAVTAVPFDDRDAT